jgi:hypothetical protein
VSRSTPNTGVLLRPEYRIANASKHRSRGFLACRSGTRGNSPGKNWRQALKPVTGSALTVEALEAADAGLDTSGWAVRVSQAESAKAANRAAASRFVLTERH